MRMCTNLPDPGGQNSVEHVGSRDHPEAAMRMHNNIPDPGGHNRVEHVVRCAHPEAAMHMRIVQ